jgi:ABC-type nitrate/sulfonate/bicarbonate transport system substrate-binding protein
LPGGSFFLRRSTLLAGAGAVAATLPILTLDDLAFAADAPPPTKPVTIRMGWGIPAEEIHYVMLTDPSKAPNLGRYYTIVWNQFAGTALGVQGIAAGTLDAATVGSLSMPNGIEQGADIVAVGQFIEERQPNFSTAWMYKKTSGIKTLADLKGKNVATSAIGGSTDYIQDFYIRDKAKLSPGTDYKKIELPFAQQQEALLNGKIDLGLFPQPFYGRAIATGLYEPLFRLTDVQNPFVQLMQGFSGAFIKANPVAVRKFMEDWVTVANYISDRKNRDAVIATTNAVTKIPISVLDTFMLTNQDFFRPPQGRVNIQALQSNWDFFRKEGGIKKQLKVTNYLSPLSSVNKAG